MQEEEEEEELVFKVKKGGKSSIKKREREGRDDEEEEVELAAGRAGAGAGAGVFSSSMLAKKRKNMGKGGGAKAAEEEQDFHNASLGTDMTSLGVAFKSSGTAATLHQNTATRILNVDEGHAGDQLFESSKKQEEILSGEQAEAMAAAAGEGLYQGQAGYKEFVNKKREKVTQSNAGGLRAGPLKGLATVRISSRFDYAPAICKDYKETGFCGFGDSCVFMHDRGDYKMGWELDKEWDAEQKRTDEENDPNQYLIEEGAVVDEEDVDSDDDLPFACLICRKDFTNPIITKCKHYFCEKCALKHFTKTPSCFACNANTQGVFNIAKEFKVKLAEKKKRMEKRTAEIAAREAALHIEEEDDNNDDQEEDDPKN